MAKLASYLALAYMVAAFLSGAYFKYEQAKRIGVVNVYVLPTYEMDKYITIKAALWPFYIFEDEQRNKARTQARTVILVVKGLAFLTKGQEGIGAGNPASMEQRIDALRRLDSVISDLRLIDKGAVDGIYQGLGTALTEQLLPAVQALKEYQLTGDLNKKKRSEDLLGLYEEWSTPRLDSILRAVNQSAL